MIVLDLPLFLLKNKSETFNAFKVYKAKVENQLSKNIKVLRSDRGGEYFSSEFNSFCEDYGMSVPHPILRNTMA